jgi:putative transcriptional regulator
MIRHPAPEELLLDYAAGNLAAGPMLAVAVHVALNPGAQEAVEDLNAIGGSLLDGEQPAALRPGMLDAVLARVEEPKVQAAAEHPRAYPGFDWAPPPLLPFLDPAAKWRSVLGRYDEMRLDVGGEARVGLVRLAPGRGLPIHKHIGFEYTVILQGGYADATGSYDVGDFAIGRGTEQHEPIALPGKPCIALTVVESPIVLTGAWGRWLNPLLRRGLI